MIGPGHILAVALLVTGTSGCTLVDLLLGSGAISPPFDPNEPFPSFQPFPSAAAAFTSGRATLELDGRTIVLDELAGEASIDPGLGTHVSWENEDGWYLTFTSYPDDFQVGGGGYLSIDRIQEHEHWVAVDPTRCVTVTEQADKDGVKGTATCRGLRWSDFFSAYSGLGPKPIPSEPPFDLDITFEAH